jgi:hypothetical protein
MHVRHIAAVVALVMGAAAGTANADTVYTVTATYDPDFSSNTTFTIDNLSNSTLSGVDILGFSPLLGNGSESLGQIAAHSSATYTFGDNGALSGGPFQISPGNNGVPDTTNYQVTASFQGQTLTTSLFSSVTNATGHYVDFLGACYTVQSCSEPSPQTIVYDLTGTVAVSTVPLPPALALFAGGLVGFAGRIRRRLQA